MYIVSRIYKLRQLYLFVTVRLFKKHSFSKNIRIAICEGDLEIGQISGLIDAVLPVADIVAKIWEEFKLVMLQK